MNTDKTQGATNDTNRMKQGGEYTLESLPRLKY